MIVPNQLTFLDFFSGIGGFRVGMELAGHKCLRHCEKDKFANRSYKAIHNIREDEWFQEDISHSSSDRSYADKIILKLTKDGHIVNNLTNSMSAKGSVSEVLYSGLCQQSQQWLYLL